MKGGEDPLLVSSELAVGNSAMEEPIKLNMRPQFTAHVTFADCIRALITKQVSSRMGVIVIAVDRLQSVNGTMGRMVACELLHAAMERLAAYLGGGVMIDYLSGDEIGVLIPDVQSTEQLADVARRTLVSFEQPFRTHQREVFLSCRAGIAQYPSDTRKADDLVRYADLALLFSKRSGARSFSFYRKEMESSAEMRLTVEAEMRSAMERGQFELHYQPKVLLADGVVTGSEALIRWPHPIIGNINADLLIDVAEETGFIVELGLWVLREACNTAVEWNVPGVPLHTVAINLSALQLRSRNLAAIVRRVLDETGCRPQWIEFEITESTILDGDGCVRTTLAELRTLGISIAVDDFGTGYSALGYIARYPIDTLKLDRSFISGLITDRHCAEVVKAVLSLAKGLEQNVVAEGIETFEQVSFLRAHGCKTGQGFLYGRPVSKREFNSALQLA